jgi:hypothetical protein
VKEMLFAVQNAADALKIRLRIGRVLHCIAGATRPGAQPGCSPGGTISWGAIAGLPGRRVEFCAMRKKINGILM